MSLYRTRRVSVWFLAFICLRTFAQEAHSPEAFDILREFCKAPAQGSRKIRDGQIGSADQRIGSFSEYAFADGGVAKVISIFREPEFRIIELYSAIKQGGQEIRRANISAKFDRSCKLIEAKRIQYGAQGKASKLVFLDPQLRPRGEIPINPPVPPAPEGQGLMVAMIDSGVNYLLPEITRHLARDRNGELIGFDFDEMDARPFDADPSRFGPFVPIHHGTSVASVLIKATGGPVYLAPFIAPKRPRPGAFKALFDKIESNNIRLINLSLGSMDPRASGYWDEFAQELARRTNMIVVAAAGNNGVNLDTQPQFPASYNLKNIILVASTTGNGELSAQSNYGNMVDIAVPSDPIQGIDFSGNPKALRGTSFAAPIVSGLIANLLGKNPSISISEIKKNICQRGQPLKGNKVTRCGYIP